MYLAVVARALTCGVTFERAAGVVASTHGAGYVRDVAVGSGGRDWLGPLEGQLFLPHCFDAWEVIGMNGQSYLLVTLNFVIIGGLPALTLRRGRLTAGWWVTGAPMFLAPITVISAWSGVLAVSQAGFSELREALLTVAALASITLVAYTAGSHRIPVALWHQRDDAPVEIVTWGPYRLVRHPFYVSYHLALLAALAVIPSWPTTIALVFGAVVLRMTALREEHRLLGSDLGAEYAVYRERTGRFLPRLKAVRR